MATTTNTEAPNTLLSTQTLKVLDALCEGPISGFIIKSGDFGTDPLCATYYDDVPVRNPDGSYNFNVSGDGFSFNYMLGEWSQTGIPGFQKVECVVPLSSNTRVANPPQGGGPYKTVAASFTTNTFPDADSVKVTLKIPALYGQDDNGNTNPYYIEFAVDIAVNGGAYEAQPIAEGDSSTTFRVDGKCTQPYLLTRTFKLPKPGGDTFYEWKIRVRRTSENILLLKTQNELFVESISVVSTTPFAYPNTAMVATEISSDQFSNIPVRSYEIAGMLVNVPSGYTPTDYPITGGIVPASYPTVWDGTFVSGVWTDNPAWIFYDLLTNPVHGLGDYITSSYVDKWTLYSISQYCDTLVTDENGGYEPQFTCNVQIQQPEEAYTVLLNLASTFRGMLYYANGTIHTVQTRADPPVFSFTNANVVDGVFNYADSARNTRATVAVVKWVDPDNGYRESVQYVEDTEGILKYGYNEKSMTAFACTSRGQAYRLGKWTLETERLQTETVTFQTDLEGLYLRPGDNFAIYDNFRNNKSQGGRITAFQTGRSVVTIDRPVAILSGPTYTLTALIPQLSLMGTGDITGSDQISLIRNSQIETYEVITPATTSTSTLTIQGQFNSGLYVGSPFVLSTSGYTGTFDTASFYTCLATAEIEPGKVEILGLKAMTGVYFNVLTGTPVIDYTYPGYDWPANPGDSAAVAAPSNLVITKVTGALNDNKTYSSLKLTWTDSPDPALEQYIISGKPFDGAYKSYTTTANGTQGFIYDYDHTGLYTFQLAAQAHGIYSAFINGTHLVTGMNFLGMDALSGIWISEDYDPLYVDPVTSKYTGYIGRTPTFSWNITENDKGQVPTANFVSGYEISLRNFADDTDLITPFVLTGSSSTSYEFASDTIDNFVGGAARGFKFKIRILDIDNQYWDGATLDVDNPPMKPPISSGFMGYNGGVSYNVTPAVQYDTSDIYLWCDASPSFSPTFPNAELVSSNLAGIANIAPYSGSFYTWFALSDTWGPTGNAIYGPISGNADQAFGTFSMDISSQINNALAEIDNAFLLITGEITDYILYVSGNANKAITSVDALSGQVTGLPGEANTALNVRVNSIVVSSSGALSTQIDAVRALTELTGQALTATVGTVTTALTNTGVALGQTITVTNANLSGFLGDMIVATGGELLASQATADGALSSWITNLGVQTTGNSAAVRIAAEALVTGSTDGLGGRAIARWGFELSADGKASSLKATTSSFTDIGDLVLGNMNIKSSTFTPGSAGWQISYDGNAEFNTAVVRGAFTGGSVAANYLSMDSAGFKVATAGATDRVEIATAATNSKSIDIYNASNALVVRLNSTLIDANFHGALELYDYLGNVKAKVYGNGAASFDNDVHIGDGTNGWLYLDNDTSQIVFGAGTDVNLYRGGANQLKTDDDLVIIGDCSAASFNSTSSRRWKENIQPLSGVMDMIYDLQGITFDWNTKDVKHDIGFIAEDVYKVLPTVVGKDSDGSINGLEYGKLTVLSIEAIKELDRRLKELENKEL